MTKEWTLRFRAGDKDFDAIKSGLKTIETRANSERYADIKAGDIAVFVCGDEQFRKKIKRVLWFKTIAGMTRILPLKKIMPSVASVKEMRAAYYSYPEYKEKIKKFGIVAMLL